MASVITRAQEWLLVKADRISQAVEQATAAMAERLRQGTPAELGRRAVQHFWNAFHDARMAMSTDDSAPALPEPTPA